MPRDGMVPVPNGCFLGSSKTDWWLERDVCGRQSILRGGQEDGCAVNANSQPLARLSEHAPIAPGRGPRRPRTGPSAPAEEAAEEGDQRGPPVLEQAEHGGEHQRAATDRRGGSRSSRRGGPGLGPRGGRPGRGGRGGLELLLEGLAQALRELAEQLGGHVLDGAAAERGHLAG